MTSAGHPAVTSSDDSESASCLESRLTSLVTSSTSRAATSAADAASPVYNIRVSAVAQAIPISDTICGPVCDCVHLLRLLLVEPHIAMLTFDKSHFSRLTSNAYRTSIDRTNIYSSSWTFVWLPMKCSSAFAKYMIF